jgi:amidase
MQGHILFPGFISRNGGMGDDIIVIGPLARSAKDIEKVMKIIVKPGETDRTAWRIELPPPRKIALKEYKIGLWLDDPANPVDGRVGDRIQTFVEDLAKLAPNIVDQKPEIDFQASHDVYVRLAGALNGSILPDEVFEKINREKKRLTGRGDAKAQFVKGATQLHREWMMLNIERIRLQQQWAAFFKGFDALLMPVAPVAAFPHDHKPFYSRHLTVNGREAPYVNALYGWAGLAGVAYLPATVVPVGLTSTGLPVGIQIVGPYLEDRTTIHLATLIEDAMGGFVPPPLP